MRRFVKQTLLISSITMIGLISMGMLSARMLGAKTLSVQSGSMAPKIHKGDLVLVKHVPYQDLRVGDIITYVSPENKAVTITHRVVSTPSAEVPTKFVVKGDANADADPLVDYTSIVGRVDHMVPYVGHIFDFLRTWPGLIVLIYIPTLWIIVSEFQRLAAYYRSRIGYVLAGYDRWYGKRPSRKPMLRRLSFGTTTLAATILSSVAPVYAAIQTHVMLTASSIDTIAKVQPATATPPPAATPTPAAASPSQPKPTSTTATQTQPQTQTSTQQTTQDESTRTGDQYDRTRRSRHR